MGRVDHDRIGAGLKQGLGAFKGVRRYPNGGGHQQAVLVVDGGMAHHRVQGDALHVGHFTSLGLNRHVLVDDPHPPLQGHGDRHR